METNMVMMFGSSARQVPEAPERRTLNSTGSSAAEEISRKTSSR
jgi:hypothetical protein